MPPPRPHTGSPPRQALHEKSDSHTNEGPSSTLRMVGEPQVPISGVNPYPTKPSQILSPSGYSFRPGLAFQDTPEVQTPFDESFIRTREGGDDFSFGGKERDSWQGTDAGRITERSSADVSFYTASAMGSTPTLTSNAERSPTPSAMDPTQRLTQMGPAGHRPDPSDLRVTTTPEAQCVENESAPEREHRPANKDSDNSLSSSNSTGTVIVKKARDGKKRASYSAFPYTGRPSSSKSNIPSPTSPRSMVPGTSESAVQGSPVSPCTPVSATFPSSSERRISSAPEADASNYVQYPIIKPPSASGSWAQSSNTVARQPPRALERAQERWNPHLSTVQSEGTTSSMSGERTSQGMWLSDSSRGSKSSSNMLSPRISTDLPPIPTRSSFDVPTSMSTRVNLTPLPCPPHDLSAPPQVQPRDLTGSTIRVVGEQEGETLKVPPTIPGSRDSEKRASNLPGDRRSGAVMRPGSRASFFRDSIPAWAKTYYARPISSTSNSKNDPDRRTSTSTDNISLNIFRPRNRTPRSNLNPDRRISGLSMHPTRPQELSLAGTRNSASRRISPTWSPHLWHDRTSLGRRRSMFKPPSIDEQAEGHALTRRNIQVAMFAVGFVFPLGWFLAAFLPLPPRPAIPTAKGKNAPRRLQIVQDLEDQLIPGDEGRYENARWWRNINRIMCVVGFMVIIAIVSLQRFIPFQNSVLSGKQIVMAVLASK